MKVVITGASGLIGSALKKRLLEMGHDVLSVTRSPKGPQDIAWDIKKKKIEKDKFEGVDSVVHLAGESIFGFRWTERKMSAILESRVDSTRLLVDLFREMDTPPATFLSGSAVGIYGDMGEKKVDETDVPGAMFLSDVCRGWEREARRAETFGVRVVRARTGLVLSQKGGMLEQMRRIFSLGLGGRLGDGKQGMSWISLEDEVGALVTLLLDSSLEGAFNLVAPNPVSNSRFTKVFAEALKRPALAPVPAFAIEWMLGDMGKELLLSGVYAVPRRLVESGYSFVHPTLTDYFENGYKC